RTAVGADGRWACDFEPPLEHGRAVEVTVVDRAQNASDGGSLAVDATPPSGVTVAPTDGRQVTGAGETPGDVITVRDAGGQVLCRVVVGAELTWACALEPVAAEGDILTIAAEDQFGNRVESAWRVGLPRLDLAEPVLRAGARQTATARNYQPGETVALNPDATSSAAQPGAGSTDMADAVVAVLTASEGASGAGSADTSDAALSAVADANGTVVFAWTVPADTAPGERLVEARGAVSGAANARFAVEQPANSGPALTSPTLPFTGAEGVVGLIGLAGGLLLAGALLLLATRRRRQSTPDRP
ncbi:MAG: Ig-like domain-containing protein, partial [Bifidobacteriaceae bacterium]|nr:Ig-like domain-containing protein [Bifidobacteriaceae bacterium]